MLCIILYTSVKSALSRLYSSDGNPSFLSLSGYGRFLTLEFLETSFVARLCTFSIAIMSFLNSGVQTVVAYSRCGLTMVL